MTTEDKNPNEFDFKHPAKAEKAQEKVPIKESGFGREKSQTPADEHIESFSQIDNETANKQSGSAEDSEADEEGLRDSINDSDERDFGDSTTDWDAQHNRSGRHK